MNIWHDIAPERITPDDFMVYVEIPKGCKNKYELDKETGLLMLDRVLYTSTHYPASYGFIPRTYADDKDPLDVLLMCTEPIYPSTLVRCYPIGAIVMLDGGARDEKIIAIPFGEPNFNCYRDISALPSHILQEMQHFFSVYKQLEGKQTAVREFIGRNEALETVRQAIADYNEKILPTLRREDGTDVPQA